MSTTRHRNSATLDDDRANMSVRASADPRAESIWVDPGRVGGAPCFRGSRVPIKTLFDYLQTGETLDDFLDGFPGVTRDQAERTLDFALDCVVKGLPLEPAE